VLSGGVALAARCVLVAVAAVAVGLGVAAAASSGSLASISLRASDVPGFRAVSPGVETFGDAHDQGPGQAFVQCAGGIVLLDQDPGGPGALVSSVYGRGRNPFGTPRLSAGTYAFGNGSRVDADRAYQALAGRRFEDCWARVTDRLNTEQGVVVPYRPSQVTQVPAPKVGDRAVAFAQAQHYSVLGRRIFSQQTMTVIQRGAHVVMLIALSYGSDFPETLRLAIARRLASHLSSGTPPPPATSCIDAGWPRPTLPVLTTVQAVGALHVSVRFAGVSSSGGAQTCQWRGATLPPPRITPYRRFTVQLWLSMQKPYASDDAAHAAYAQQASAFGTPTKVAGLGDAAVYIPGQDEVTASLLVLAGREVFELSLNSPQLVSGQQAELYTAAEVVLDRLGYQRAKPIHRKHWASDWAGSRFCARAAPSHYLGTTWRGVAACGEPYPNNDQGTIQYGRTVFDTVGFQCVELAERYFYWVTGQPGPFANGSDVAEAIYAKYHRRDPNLGLYPAGTLGRTSTYQHTLQPGDILSLWSRADEIGHVGVVKGVSLHRGRGGKPTGTITILNENTTHTNGVNTITVTNGQMYFADGSYPYFQWLYGLPN
jgi:hypothetical protein